ncbi:hypothetical protein [Halodesulfovibrio sp. MK-HDV]|uniref:hypothetical protein n=1 Tax=Halodesulfovibrio sp. MK-HDV TaxID=2599925 RepID=UPI00136CF489|nr:hypothetical protein [Halodesulfovibrio sp. MK-HDV]KAF1073932.1 hypothetical protein MKHDV_03272 [Halodesulfovibrio sp. MK-HDV]
MQNHGAQKNSGLNLANRLKSQMDTEAQQSKKIMQHVFSNLKEELQQSMTEELSSMQRALMTETAEYKKLQDSIFHQMKTQLKLPVIISMTLTILICGIIIAGTSTWFHLEKKKLVILRQTNNELTLNNQQLDKWGISTLSYEGNHYVIFPKGTKLQERTTKDGSMALLIME